MASDSLRVLVLSAFDGTNANVIRDFLFCFRAHSRHRYYYIFDCRVLDADIDFDAFDVILVFWNLYDIRSDLSCESRARIRASRASKVLFLQDEYRDVLATNHVMAELGINVMFTCVAECDHDLFYPPQIIPSLEATYTVLTGYVPAYLERPRPDVVSPRPLDIGYRSRDAPYHLGDLGQEKRLLAERFPAIAAAHGLTSDISVREHDRLYGQRWSRFLASVRCVLGSASGASVVDLTGDIRRRCERYLAIHPGAGYDDVKQRFFADVDWKIVIDTVSPRIFEAVALGSTLVHHEGRYGGLLIPDVHYIRVARDYANVDEVVDRIKDRAFCREVALRAWRDLIGSGLYSYRAFAERFDALLERHAHVLDRAHHVSQTRFYASAYVRRGQALVPFRSGFIVLPSGRLVFRLARWVLAKVASPGGRLPAQLIDNPAELIARASHAFAIVRGSTPLRTIFGVYWRDRARQRMGAYDLLNELVKIDIVSRVRGGLLDSGEPFSLTARFDGHEQVVELTSHPGNRPDENRMPLTADLVEALRTGAVRAIIWDHSAVGMQVVYRLPRRGLGTGRSGWIPVRVGASGVFTFSTLASLARQSPDLVGQALVTLLAGAPSKTPASPDNGTVGRPSGFGTAGRSRAPRQSAGIQGPLFAGASDHGAQRTLGGGAGLGASGPT